MNKKTTIALASVLIIILVTVAALYYWNYSYSHNNKQPVKKITIESGKLKVHSAHSAHALSEEDLKNVIFPEGHTLYYFPEECPDYKQEYYIVVKSEGSKTHKYYVPEKGHLLVVPNNHEWTKEPNFVNIKFQK